MIRIEENAIAHRSIPVKAEISVYQTKGVSARVINWEFPIAVLIYFLHFRDQVHVLKRARQSRTFHSSLEMVRLFDN